MKKVIVYDDDDNITKTYESYSNKIIINYKYKYSDECMFIVKVNDEIVFDSEEDVFVFDNKKEYIKLNHIISKNGKHSYAKLKGIYIDNIWNAESLLENPHCLCYIEFDLEECIERIDGFPDDIVKINKSELNDKQIKNLENNNIIYTIYEDMNNLYFVSIDKEKDGSYNLCCLAPNLINDNNIILLKKLSRLLSIKKHSLYSECWPGGNYAYCLYGKPWFMDIWYNDKKEKMISTINKKNILNTINHLELTI